MTRKSGFKLRQAPLRCGKCRRREGLTITSARKTIKALVGTRLHGEVQCQCGHVWWSRHPDVVGPA